MIATPTSIEGLHFLEFKRFTDERGFFSGPYQAEEFAEALPGVVFNPVQLSHSRSVKGVLRGIHAEPWNKFVYVARGEVFVAYVDVRPENFGAVVTGTVQEGHGVFVPKGVGNSFQVLSDEVDYIYIVDGLWKPGTNYPMLAWNDPELSIAWPITPPGLSDKDKVNPSLSELRAKLTQE